MHCHTPGCRSKAVTVQGFGPKGKHVRKRNPGGRALCQWCWDQAFKARMLVESADRAVILETEATDGELVRG
jgi:hypothetical protein